MRALITGLLSLSLLACEAAPVDVSAPKSAVEAPRPLATSAPPPRPTSAPAALSPASTPSATRRAASSRPPVVLRVGQLGDLAEIGLAMGLSRGFYAEQGLELQLVSFSSPSFALSALLSGRLEAACLPVNVELFNALARGSSLKIVAEAAGAPPGRGAAGLLVRADLLEALSTPTDLRGFRIALAARGTSQEVELARLLKKGWLARTDVEQVIMPPEAIGLALAEARLDAAMLAEPLLSEAEAAGLGRVWVRSDRIIPNHMTAILVLSSRFARTQSEASRRLLVAYLRSARVYNDEFLRVTTGNRGELLAMLGGSTPLTLPDNFERLVLPGLNPNGMVNVQTLRMDQQQFLATGQLHKELDLAAIVDPQFVVHAIQQLGEYR